MSYHSDSEVQALLKGTDSGSDEEEGSRSWRSTISYKVQEQVSDSEIEKDVPIMIDTINGTAYNRADTATKADTTSKQTSDTDTVVKNSPDTGTSNDKKFEKLQNQMQHQNNLIHDFMSSQEKKLNDLIVHLNPQKRV